MMFTLYTLFALAAISALLFTVPLRSKGLTALILIGIGALGSCALAVRTLVEGVPTQLWSGPNALFHGDTGSMDTLSALFVLIIGIGSVASAAYSRGYLAAELAHKSPAHVSLHYTALTVMYYAMLGVVLSDGGYSFLFFWELMTVASFLLILFEAERREVRRAALSYLIMMHIGFFLLLAGFVRVATEAGSGSFGALAEYLHTRPALPLFILFLAGFGMKAGLFPMHVWLPEAHPAAPSHVSALMSGVMIKTGIYGILRTTAAAGGMTSLHTAGLILLAAGIVTGLWGIILAATQNDVKRLLAYSSIENIGVILIGIGVAALGKASGNQVVAMAGIAGALLHTVNHSFFKSLLFFGAGNLLTALRTTSLDDLGGVARHMPMTALLFLTGTVAICALPELLIYLGLFDSVASGCDTLAAAAGLAALALIGGIALLAFTKLYGTVFLGAPRTHEVAESREVDNGRIAAMALPLAGILFVGLFPGVATGIATRAAAFFLPTPADTAGWLLTPTLQTAGRTVWLLLLVAGALYWLRRRLLRNRPVTEGPTWGCGFTAPNVRMQYTGESFSEGLQSIATSLTQNNGEGAPVQKGEIFPSTHRFDIGHRDRIGRLFAAWWVELLRRINARVMRLRTGKINHYVLFALAFLALVFLLSLLKLI